MDCPRGVLVVDKAVASGSFVHSETTSSGPQKGISLPDSEQAALETYLLLFL